MNKKRVNHLFLLLLLAVVFATCLSEIREMEEVETIDAGIIDARHWFEANAHRVSPSVVTTRSADGTETTTSLNPVFNWSLAELIRDPQWEVVELPWEYEEMIDIFALWEVWQHALATNTVPDNVTRLVMVKNRTTDHRFGFKMRIAPSLNFLLNHAEDLHSNTYLHRDNRLCGIVVFYTLEGEFMNGWRYRDGIITAALTGMRPVDKEGVNVPTTRSWWFDEELPEFVVSGQAPGAGVHGDWSDITFSIEETEFIDWCKFTGTGGGSSSTTASECAPNASQIFTNAQMNCDDWMVLEELLQKLLKNCLGQALFNELKPTPLKPINFVFVDGAGGSYSSQDWRIRVGNDASPSVLFHEMFHSRQFGSGGYGQLNRELEAFLAEYLFARTQPWFVRGNDRFEFFTNHPLGQSIAELANLVGTSGHRLPNISNALIDSVIRRSGSTIEDLGPYELFRASRRADGVTPTNYAIMHFSTSTSGDQNFRTLQRLSQNCN